MRVKWNFNVQWKIKIRIQGDFNDRKTEMRVKWNFNEKLKSELNEILCMEKLKLRKIQPNQK